MVTDNAKKALEAGAINTSAQRRWINEAENCILPQFTNAVMKEGSLAPLSRVRKLLVDKEKIIQYVLHSPNGDTTLIFDFESKEIKDKKGKVVTVIPAGHGNEPYKDKAQLDVAAVHLTPAQWKQLVYLTFGVGEYTQLEYQGDKGPKPEKEKPAPPSTIPAESTTSDKPSSESDEKIGDKIVDDLDVGKHVFEDKIIYVSEMGDEAVRYIRKKNNKCANQRRYSKKRNKKRAEKAAAHNSRVEAYKTKKAAAKKEAKERKYKQPSYKIKVASGTIISPDADWCVSERKPKQPRNKRIRNHKPAKGKGLPRKHFTRSAKTNLKAYHKNVEARRKGEGKPALKRDWKNYESSPNHMSQLWAFVRLNCPVYTSKTDAELFQLRNAGLLNSTIKELNKKFDLTFKCNFKVKKLEMISVKEKSYSTLACISDGKIVYRLPHVDCMDLVEKEDKFEFVDKSEWKKARFNGTASYTYDDVTPEERRVNALKKQHETRKKPRKDKKKVYRVTLGNNGVRKSAINNKNNQPCV